jgi:hypothetical protein
MRDTYTLPTYLHTYVHGFKTRVTGTRLPRFPYHIGELAYRITYISIFVDFTITYV